MKICVLTLCRDRLPYTQHCFAKLQELAGCEFEHLILDQGSSDGTADWIRDNYPWSVLIEHQENVGIHKGMNELLAAAQAFEPDVIVKFDNDCELVQDGTLRAMAETALRANGLVSPTILGLRRPPASIGSKTFDGVTLQEMSMIGGIFMAAPASFYDGFRFDENAPTWGSDDDLACAKARMYGRPVGYAMGWVANHYETTDGQHARFPEYFARVAAEGKPA